MARQDQTATLLANGEVLVAGGQDANGNALSSAELYNPATHAWTPTGSMHTARYLAGATRLPDGRVLVAGGLESYYGNLSSAEIYDPNTGVWSVTGSMNQPRNRVATVLLNNGQVLAVGGWADQGNVALSSAELFNPATGLWTYTGSMAVARVVDFGTVVLSDGDVLVAGGVTCCAYQSLASTELYRPATGTWTTVGSMTTPRQSAPVVKLADGEVLIAGGDTGGISATTSTAEVFDPKSATWSPTQSMSVDRYGPGMTSLSNGDVLVAGGSNDDTGATINSAEVYNPTTGQWTSTGSMPVATWAPTATRLDDGTVLVAGGQVWGGQPLAQAELFTPAPTGTYQQTNLVSDIPGVARITDPSLVNPWGMSELANSPLWVSDNGTKAATIYAGDQSGSPLSPAPLVVKLDGATPTGQVANTTGKFFVHHDSARASALFLFASENGDIAGDGDHWPTPPAGASSPPRPRSPTAIPRRCTKAGHLDVEAVRRRLQQGND